MAAPFPVGGSPFQVKGNIFRGCFEYADAYVPGGAAAALVALPTSALREYLSQRFLASAWYDAFALEAFLVASATVRGVPFEAFLDDAFVTQAERDQGGVYKLLLRAISPEMLIKRLPRIGTQLFNFTRSEVVQLGPGHWHNTIFGVPDLLRTVYCHASGAFVSRALRTTGATDLQHRWLAPTMAPNAHGTRVSTLVRELRWSAR